MQKMTPETIGILHAQYEAILAMELHLVGVAATELRHLIGRLGEFKCALALKGTLAPNANQRGYDVISADGRKVSVKTTAQRSGFVPIGASTARLADDLMVIQYRDGAFRTILHRPMSEVLIHCRKWRGKGKSETDSPVINYELDTAAIKRIWPDPSAPSPVVQSTTEPTFPAA